MNGSSLCRHRPHWTSLDSTATFALQLPEPKFSFASELHRAARLQSDAFTGDRDRSSTAASVVSEALARLIERAVGPSFGFGGYRVSRSTTRAEDLEIFRFRYRIYMDSGFITRDSVPADALQDQFDPMAVQIAVRDSLGELVGAARFVRPSNLGFHTEQVFDFEFPPVPREQVGEFGRLVVADAHRGGERIVMVAVLKAVFECMIESGTTHVVAFLSPRLADSVASLGCKPLAIRMMEPSRRSLENRRAMQSYFDSQSAIPVLYDLEKMFSEVGVRRNELSSHLQLSDSR